MLEDKKYKEYEQELAAHNAAEEEHNTKQKKYKDYEQQQGVCMVYITYTYDFRFFDMFEIGSMTPYLIERPGRRIFRLTDGFVAGCSYCRRW